MQRPLIVIDKSFVPVGTANKVRAVNSTDLEKRNVNLDFHLVSNPEFWKEGDAINDFMKPDIAVLGSSEISSP